MDPRNDPDAALPDQDRSPSRLLNLARAAFVLAALGLAVWGLWPRRSEIVDALAAVPWWALLAAFAVVLGGLFVTVLLWRGILAVLGSQVRLPPAARVFFVGQVGKYIPGSLWSVAAQADLARSLGVPMRRTTTGSLLFLGSHVASALAVGGAIGTICGLPGLPRLGWVGVGVVGLIGVTPPVVAVVGRRLSGAPVHVTWLDQLRLTSLMLVAWGLYAAALVLLEPTLASHWWIGLAAYTIAYAVGVVVIFAPAGVGAREVTFVLLLAPVLDTVSAVALALLARLVHTAADLTWAALGVWWARFDRARHGGVQ